MPCQGGNGLHHQPLCHVHNSDTDTTTAAPLHNNMICHKYSSILANVSPTAS